MYYALRTYFFLLSFILISCGRFLEEPKSRSRESNVTSTTPGSNSGGGGGATTFSITYASPANNKVRIAWDAYAGSTSYSVKRGTVSGVYGTTLSANATSPYADNTAVNGTTYYYMVVASDGVTETNATAEITATPLQGFRVNSLLDTSDSSAGDGWCLNASNLCTLRAAIEESNALASATTWSVVLPTGTISISGTELSLTSKVSIEGLSQSLSTISGSNDVRIFNATGASTLNIRDVTLSNGTGKSTSGGAAGHGGAIVTAGTTALNLTDVTCSSNNTGTNGAGGCLYYNSTGGSVIDDSTFTSNTAESNGGAIWAAQSMTITDSTFNSNSSSAGNGGAILLSGNTKTFTISGCLFYSNSALGGGALALVRINGTATITNSTFTANSATNYGAICIQQVTNGTNNLVNVTIASNTATTTGGGIGTTTVGGTDVNTMKNSIVYGNTAGGVASNCSWSGNFTSLGGNMSGINDCSFSAGTDFSASNPLLAVLADNGGPTQTMALGVGSPAIDTGLNAGCPVTDQRGSARPVNGTCDIGAFESP